MKKLGVIFLSTILVSQMSFSQVTTNNNVSPDALTRICSGEIRAENLDLAVSQCNSFQLNRNYAELAALEGEYKTLKQKLDAEIRVGQKEKFKLYAYGTGAVVLGVITGVSGLATIAIASDGLKSALRKTEFRIAAPTAVVGLTLTVLSTIAAREASIAAEISAAQVENFKMLLGSLEQEAQTRKVKVAGLIKIQDQLAKK